MEFGFDGFNWHADAPLDAWSEFTDGQMVRIVFAPEGWGDQPVGQEETGLIQWVLANQTTQKDSLMSALVAAYPVYRRQFFEDRDLEDNEDDLPTVKTPSEMTKVVALEAIYVHQVAKNAVPYVGYQFDCAWDEEHGLGILMHDKRVIKIGGSDVAILLWIARQDMEQ